MPADAHIELAAAAHDSGTAQGKAMTEQLQSAIVAEGLTKSFPGVRAVDGAEL